MQIPEFKHIKCNNWGNKSLITDELITCLQHLDNYIDEANSNGARYALQVHSVTTGQHCTGSQHYKGRAVDFHIENMKFKEAIKFIENFTEKTPVTIASEPDKLANYCGLGIYPQWLHPGFHLDVKGVAENKKAPNKTYKNYRRRWAWINGGQKMYEPARDKILNS